MSVAYEENMLEKRRIEDEQSRVEDAAKAAEAVAKSFLASEDGMIMVHDEAEKRIALREQGRKDLLAAKASSTTCINQIALGVQNLRSP